MSHNISPLLRKLSQYDNLTGKEKRILDSMIRDTEEVTTHVDLVTKGSRPNHSILLLEGFCARYKSVAQGKRQITAIHISGDFLDLHSFLIKTMDHSVLTLTPCIIARVPHQTLSEITEQHPHLSRLLWLTTLVDSSIHRQWLTIMGTLEAQKHFAHLVCEMYVRLSALGLTQDYRFTLPMSRQELGEVVALASVHLGRLSQELRERGLICWSGTSIEILDWKGLVKLAEFDPTYLSIGQEPR